MFRNAYRAELDTIALAATKANIMISLNGFIISALMISGAFIFASSPEFLIPAGIFLFTAAASIIFALLAASPEQVNFFGYIREWIKAVYRGEASLSDFRRYMMRGGDTQKDDTLNLLIYSDRVRMDRDEYWTRMESLLRDRDEVYYKMSDQLYWLGLMANRKFKLLNISYTVFRWGLLVSVVVFIGIKSFTGLLPGTSGDNTLRLQNLGISELDGIYEPSAVQQLADGRILVVEDEASRAINVMNIASDGSLTKDGPTDLRLMRSFGRKLSDLEGLSIDDQGYIYAITSHSKTKKGKRLSDREQLLRFKIEGNKAGNIASYTSLTNTLQTSDVLKTAIETKTGEKINFDSLNIEGLAYYRQAKQLLLGLRNPTISKLSVIIVIENPAEVFEDQADPRFGPPILLDLKGGGIRALSYDPVLATFLIVNEIDDSEGDRYSQLWAWSGNPAHEPELIALPDIINLNNVESIDSITIQGKSRLLIMSDEGNKQKDRPAKYMMLNYEQLSM